MKIIPVSFTARDFSDFESVLNLAAPRLTRQWMLGEPTDVGDFHIISINQPGESAAFLPGPPGLDPWRVIVYANDENEAAAHWKIARREGSPPRLSELISLLNNIDQYLSSPGCAKLGDIPQAAADGESLPSRPEAKQEDAIPPPPEDADATASPAARLPEQPGGDQPGLFGSDAQFGKTAFDDGAEPVQEAQAATLLERISRFFTQRS